MMWRRVWLLLLAFPLLWLTGCSESAPSTDRLKIGEPFPEIMLQPLDGEPVSIRKYRGKLVVLNLWASWCEPCRREMPNLQRLSERLDGNRFAVIGMAQDDDDHVVREYLLDKGVHFTSYIDPHGAVSTGRLGVQFFPYTLLIAPDGRFIQRVPGPREWQRDEVVDLLERAYRGDYSGLRQGAAQ
jgi:thiol-disulfide isomerase/thioredoxin